MLLYVSFIFCKSDYQLIIDEITGTATRAHIPLGSSQFQADKAIKDSETNSRASSVERSSHPT